MSRTFIVNGIETPLGTHCVCGGTLASHSQLPPHKRKSPRCDGFQRASYGVTPPEPSTREIVDNPDSSGELVVDDDGTEWAEERNSVPAMMREDGDLS